MNRILANIVPRILLPLVDVYRLEQIRNQRVGNNHHRGTDPIFLGNIFHPKNRPAFLFLLRRKLFSGGFFWAFFFNPSILQSLPNNCRRRWHFGWFICNSAHQIFPSCYLLTDAVEIILIRDFELNRAMMCFVDGAGGSRDGRHVRRKRKEMKESWAAWSGECLVTLPAGGGRIEAREPGLKKIKCVSMFALVCPSVSVCVCVG